MHFSIVFPIIDRRDIGLWLDTISRSPFLQTGITLAIFQLLGKTQTLSDLLNSSQGITEFTGSVFQKSRTNTIWPSSFRNI